VIELVWPVDSPEAKRALEPRADIVAEQRTALDAGSADFEQSEGPFSVYSRTVRTVGDSVHDTTVYRLLIPWFGWMFAWPMRRALRDRTEPTDPKPWWSPPDRLTARQAHVLGLLAAAALSATFINTIFTQTANFAAKDFGISDSGLSTAGIIVRLGVVITIPFAAIADRIGRRKVLVMLAWAAPVATATGALAPSFAVLVATQAVARPLSLALALVIGVIVAEEMPRNSRTYAISVLALSGGLGAGVAVGALTLTDLGPGGWRLVYVIALVWLIIALSMTRSLPETRRFEVMHDRSGDGPAPRLSRRRFATIAITAISSNTFVAPASFLQNNYLEKVRDYSGSGIALFTFCTATPASIGLMLGGNIADRFGRRPLIVACLPAATAMIVISFASSGPLMWVSAGLGGLLGGAAYPALHVYQTELFPTGNRGRANGLITALSLGGSSIGLLIAGQLIDAGWSYGETMGVLAFGQIVAATIVLTAYPETAHLELETLNPEDSPVVLT
jgi:MFS family permease